MEKRTTISKKLRFDIFKRDLFCCQYCGKTPPATVLEIDHIKPVSKGGNNRIDNLLTSCFDCNRGKGKHELNVLPESTANKIIILKEKEAQYKAYQKIQRNIEKRVCDEIDLIEQVYSKYFNNWELQDRFKNDAVKKFINTIGFQETYDAMEKACCKINNAEQSLKYFCGICWNKINNI